jgi:hypothetical protein
MCYPRLNEIEHRCFQNRPDCLCLFPGRRRSRERENSGSDDGPDTDAGKSERAEYTLHLTLGRFCLSNQMVGAFGSEKLKRHDKKSCHHSL